MKYIWRDGIFRRFCQQTRDLPHEVRRALVRNLRTVQQSMHEHLLAEVC